MEKNKNKKNNTKTKIPRFDTPKATSKIGICGVPLRADTYSGCTFGCTYCFSNNRKIMGHTGFQVANLKKLDNTLDRIFNKGEIEKDDLTQTLIADRITWHLGGMSDPFCHYEKDYHITKQFIDITNKYGISLLISTKSDTVYGADIRPELHSFQLSISNVYNDKSLEPNVPDIESRYRFYRELKDKGFKVGIRIQPFIPNKTTLDIIEMFKDADNITLEGLKMVPQNKEHVKKTLAATNLTKDDFWFASLWNLKPEIKLEMYKPFIQKMEEYNIPYSIADNELRYISKNKCCCGDRLVKKALSFNTTALIQKYGIGYNRCDALCELGSCKECECKKLFASNRQEGVVTVEDFINRNFHNKKNSVSKEFQRLTEDGFYRKYL